MYYGKYKNNLVNFGDTCPKKRFFCHILFLFLFLLFFQIYTFFLPLVPPAPSSPLAFFLVMRDKLKPKKKKITA